MYDAEMAGEQMGSVCLAEVVPGVVVAEERSAAGSGFLADVDVLRRELGLAGQAFEVVASACRMTGVPAEGGLVEQAAACRAALVGGPRAAGKALHAPAAAQTQVAPAAAQMDRGVPIAGREGPLRLTLASHPGQALTVECDCCCPFPPPVFVCCCSGVRLGDEHHAMQVVYNPSRGQLLRPEACNQRIHNTWENFVPNNEVNSFHCGCFDCVPHESWTLYSDGTIHSKYHPELVLGARDDGKLCLVRQEDQRRRLVFREVLAMEKIRINNAAVQLDNVADCAGGLLACGTLVLQVLLCPLLCMARCDGGCDGGCAGGCGGGC